MKMRARLNAYFVPLANVALRGVALASRFLLAIYLAKYIGIGEVGVFGMIQGAVSVLPVVLGWGITYFLGRDLVGLSQGAAGRMLRDRLAVTLLSCVGAAGLFALAVLGGLIVAPQPVFEILAIVVLETLAFDMHIGLISLGMPLAASALLFVRSAAWAIPVVILGIVFPELRNLQLVFDLWLLALLANFAGLYLLLRRWPLGVIARSVPDFDWLRRSMRKGRLIYVNDLSILGTLYLDRYVVNHFIGLAATGTFVLYWSIANAVNVLVSASVIQIALPALVEAFRAEGDAGWRRAFRRELWKVMAIAIPLALAVFAVTIIALPRMGIASFTPEPALFSLLMVATIIRLGADMLSYGLYSRGMDRELALINVVGFFVSATMTVAFVMPFGLIGAGVAAVIVACLLLAARAVALSIGRRRHAAGGRLALIE